MSDEASTNGESDVVIFGVGGAGGNAAAGLTWSAGLRVVCANTDRQALEAVTAPHRLQLGRRLTGGLGAGAAPETGRLAAEEALPEVRDALKRAALCIVVAGLGGGTGTGAAPVIAQAARSLGILTIGVAIMPFAFEGARRARIAAQGAIALEGSVDALVTVRNQNLFRTANLDTTLADAFRQTDAFVRECATGYAGLLSNRALKRATIADMRSILCAGGKSVVGFGEHHFGPDRALLAARSALRHPLLENIAQGARRLLVTVTGGEDLRLFEVSQAIAYLRDVAHPDAELVWGATTDSSLGGGVRVGIAATELAEAPAVAITTAVEPAFPRYIMPAPHRPDHVAICDIAENLAVSPARMPVEEAVEGLPEPCARADQVASQVQRARQDRADAGQDDPVVKHRAGEDVLLLHEACQLRPNPEIQKRVHARSDGASLADRAYFTVRDVSRRWRGTLHAVLPATSLVDAAFTLHGGEIGMRPANRRRRSLQPRNLRASAS